MTEGVASNPNAAIRPNVGIVVLAENSPNPAPDSGLVAEHGLSVAVEAAGRRVLFDAGASDAFWQNATRLGIDPRAFEALVVSHGHADHAGGAVVFAARNPESPIWARRTVFGDFWSFSSGAPHFIGIDRALANASNLRLLDGDAELAPGFRVFGNVRARRLQPRGAAELKVRTTSGDWIQDAFDHEQHLVVETRGRRVLFCSCAHSGIANILDRFRELFGGAPDVVVGGFHTRRKDEYSREDEALIEALGRELEASGATFYTGHCTGARPYEILKARLGERLKKLHTGLEFDV